MYELITDFQILLSLLGVIEEQEITSVVGSDLRCGTVFILEVWDGIASNSGGIFADKEDVTDADQAWLDGEGFDEVGLSVGLSVRGPAFGL